MTGLTPPVLEARGAGRLFGRGRDRLRALDAVSISLATGTITALIGPSGSGKSTLLRVLAGLETLDEGEVLERGASVSRPGFTAPPETRRVGVVFQDYALFPHLDARANVAFGLQGLAREERRARADDWLARVGLGDRGAAFPHQLSGGEQQRVALARALAPEPHAVLLDEPFSGLDPYLRADLQARTLATLRQAGTAALIVSHDTEEALAMADQVAIMRAGAILQAGAPGAVHAAPRSLAVARALGPVWSMEARAAGGWIEGPLGPLPTSLPDGPCRLWGRPETTRLSVDPEGPFETMAVRGVGRMRRVFLRAGEALVEAEVEAGDAPPVGARVRVVVAAEDVRSEAPGA
jgi:iron(III) transport system ATP-binding protein